MKRFIPRRHVRQGVIKEITFDGMLVFISPALQRWGLEIGHFVDSPKGINNPAQGCGLAVTLG